MTDPLPWLGGEDLAGSDLVRWIRPMVREPSTASAAAAVFEGLVTRLAARDCLMLAESVARSCADAVVVRFDDDHRGLAHAVVGLGARPGDVLAGDSVDVLGRRPTRVVSARLAELGGSLVATEGGRLDEADLSPGTRRAMLAMAGCLPWMRGIVPARFAVADGDALACLGWLLAREAAEPGGGWTGSLPPA